MEMDVNLSKSHNGTIEPLMTISAGSYSTSASRQQSTNNNNNNNNGTTPANTYPNSPMSRRNNATASTATATSTSPITQRRRTGCCGILSRLLCTKRSTAKTASSSNDYNNLTNSAPPPCNVTGNGSNNNNKKLQHRRTPQEIYFESRGKSCKKLLKFNGSSNKILLYPEEGWARTASSSYWTITPCWWQPNRCVIEEFSGTQRNTTKAKMVQLEQKGSLLIAGHFIYKKQQTTNVNYNSSYNNDNTNNCHRLLATPSISICGDRSRNNRNTNFDEFKLYLSSNISIEDYNMGYCLTGFVERRCQQTNTFQMTHFAVIKRQWPSLGNKTETKATTT